VTGVQTCALPISRGWKGKDREGRGERRTGRPQFRFLATLLVWMQYNVPMREVQ